MVAGFMRGGAEFLESRLKSSPRCGWAQGRQVRVSEQGISEPGLDIWDLEGESNSHRGGQRRDLGREIGRQREQL